jgi:hypothetical protein
MVKKILILGLLSFILFINGAGVVLAQVQASDCTEYCTDPYHPDDNPGGLLEPSGNICLCSPLSSLTLEDLLENIISYIFVFATVITPLLIIIAGFYFVTSGGDLEKVNKAKRIIFYTLLGYAIVLFSRGLVSILKGILGG